ncbi:Inner membrane protein alx [Metalysinibacillus saudimassiliensis]|uniref:Inner membrane protein alx n=1 Tax=Metalysinibacillus saudimassiliensis TaxID=1461583 RepID=A0A078M4C2_9BACL|nr:Inner membrane protein alx [Metalysinibacillus saudimassiliensis]
MELLNGILSTYASFFDLDMWIKVLSDPVNWGLIGTLVIIEGLLSADNALVLAVMVRHLPEKQRKKALFYGLIGAYFFRFLAIGVGVFLIKLWWVKVLGAAYLAWLAIQYFIEKSKGGGTEEEIEDMKAKGFLMRIFGTFWGTVVAVELMDIAFSVDSVLAAFGVSEKVWVLLLGGMIGILMMRGIAGVFLKLIERVPELETTAYLLILLIAAKMLLSVFGFEISHVVFFIILIVMFALTFVVHAMNNKKAA